MGVAVRLIDKLHFDNCNLVTAAGNVIVTNEGMVSVNKTVGQATTVTLKASPEKGEFIFVKDAKGDAGTNNITVQGAAAATIDGASTYVINENYGGALFEWNGTEWNIQATYKENASQATGTFTTLNATTLTVPTISGTTAFTGHLTTTDGVASGTARVMGGTAFNAVVASTAVASTSVETLYDQNYNMPANTLKAGSLVKIRYQGIATTIIGSDTLAFKLYLGGLGGTALITAAAATASSGATFVGEFELVCRTAGATGTMVGYGTYKVLSAEGTMTVKDVKLASTSVNTQAAQVIGVSVTANTANANSSRLDVLSVEVQ